MRCQSAMLSWDASHFTHTHTNSHQPTHHANQSKAHGALSTTQNSHITHRAFLLFTHSTNTTHHGSRRPSSCLSSSIKIPVNFTHNVSVSFRRLSSKSKFCVVAINHFQTAAKMYSKPLWSTTSNRSSAILHLNKIQKKTQFPVNTWVLSIQRTIVCVVAELLLLGLRRLKSRRKQQQDKHIILYQLRDPHIFSHPTKITYVSTDFREFENIRAAHTHTQYTARRAHMNETRTKKTPQVREWVRSKPRAATQGSQKLTTYTTRTHTFSFINSLENHNAWNRFGKIWEKQKQA